MTGRMGRSGSPGLHVSFKILIYMNVLFGFTISFLLGCTSFGPFFNYLFLYRAKKEILVNPVKLVLR